MTQFYSKSKANAVDYTNKHTRNLSPIKFKNKNNFSFLTFREFGRPLCKLT